jgi:O-antigen ligase
MTILIFLGFPIAFLVFRQIIELLRNRDLLSSASLTFLASVFISFLISSEDKVQQLYGATGRNTGLLTLIGFLLVFLGLVHSVTGNFARDFSITFIILGLLSGIYGFFQFLDLDPANWVNPYSPVIGFLGNPNFQSSFIGMSFVFLLSFMLEKNLSISKKALALLVQILFLFNIYETKSQQGLIIVFLGTAWVLYNKIRNSKYKGLGQIYLALTGVGGFIGALGTLNIGPLRGFIYTDSVTYRGDYWRAGLKMFQEHPLFGVGLDAYGTWYTRARDLKATVRRGGNVVSSAAHNVYIDMASNGGIFLLLSYVVINFLVLIAIIKTVRMINSFDPFFVGVSAAWFAFQAQSLISINQIGLSVWGWALSGAIVGYSKFLSTKQLESHKPTKSPTRRNSSSINSKVSPKFVIQIFVGLLIGGALGLPPYIAETKYMTSIQSGDATKILSAAYLSPNTPRRMIQVASAFQENKIDDQALKIGLDEAAKYPDFLDGWKFLYQLPASSSETKAKALAEIRRLDPLNPEFK